MSEKEEFQSSQLSTVPARVEGPGPGAGRPALFGVNAFLCTPAGSGDWGTGAGGGGSTVAGAELSEGGGNLITPAGSFEPALCSHGRTRSAAATRSIAPKPRKNLYFLPIPLLEVPDCVIYEDQRV